MSGSPFGILEFFSTQKAADAQEEAAGKATAAQLHMYNQSRADLAPWLKAGTDAIGRLEGQIAAGPGEFVPEKEPGYQFGFKNFIEQPYLSSQSAKGKRLSGETVKGLTKYAQDYASTTYDNFLARYYQRLNPNLSIAGMGQTSALQGTQNALATGQGVGQNYLNAGAAQAAGYMGMGNVASNQFTQAGNALQQYYGAGYGGATAGAGGTWGAGGAGWGGTTAGSAAGAESMVWL